MRFIGLMELLEKDASIVVERALSCPKPLPAIKLLAQLNVPMIYRKSHEENPERFNVGCDVKVMAGDMKCPEVIKWLDARRKSDEDVEDVIERQFDRLQRQKQEEELFYRQAKVNYDLPDLPEQRSRVRKSLVPKSATKAPVFPKVGRMKDQRQVLRKSIGRGSVMSAHIIQDVSRGTSSAVAYLKESKQPQRKEKRAYDASDDLERRKRLRAQKENANPKTPNMFEKGW